MNSRTDLENKIQALKDEILNLKDVIFALREDLATATRFQEALKDFLAMSSGE